MLYVNNPLTNIWTQVRKSTNCFWKWIQCKTKTTIDIFHSQVRRTGLLNVKHERLNLTAQLVCQSRSWGSYGLYMGRQGYYLEVRSRARQFIWEQDLPFTFTKRISYSRLFGVFSRMPSVSLFLYHIWWQETVSGFFECLLCSKGVNIYQRLMLTNKWEQFY